MVDVMIRSAIALAIVVIAFFFTERLGSGSAADASDGKPETEALEEEH